MPEIGGPNAILINPENPDEITEKMLQLERDSEFYARQEEIGLHQASLFSWRQTAEQLLELYEEVYKEIWRLSVKQIQGEIHNGFLLFFFHHWFAEGQ